LPALGALLIWVILLNGGTLAINSVFDRDEGDIGYLNAPPPLPRHLLAFSGALLAGGQLLAFALPPAFRVAYAICVVLSILYSVPPFRFKAVAGVDWVINMWGFGTLTPFAAWAATGRPLDAGHALVLLGFCPLFAGLYPLTQLYQMEEDRRRGDRTLALLLGLRASLGVAIACTVLAFALFGWAAALLRVGAWPLVVPLATWLAVLGAWYGRREARSRRSPSWERAWPWLSFLLDGRAPAARKASRGPRLWASSAPLYSAPSISSCCGPSRRIPGPGTRSAAAARGGICRSGGCSV